MWPNPQIPADLVTSTEEILNGKLYFLCSGGSELRKIKVRDLGGVNSIVPRPSYISGAATGGVIKEGVIKNFSKFPRVSFLTKLEASGM